MMKKTPQTSNIILITGPSGAGRSTAINVFEDIGFEVIDNMPLSLISRMLSGPPTVKNIALGVDVRTRDFSAGRVLDLYEEIAQSEAFDGALLFLDCETETLIRRYSETRRRHPLSPDTMPEIGIEEEKKILTKLRVMADVLIDTTQLSPHDLKAELARLYKGKEAGQLAVTLHSFSYKRGVPRGIDMTIDCRFLNNPYWDQSLRALNGKDQAVKAYVQNDPRYSEFLERLSALCKFLLPAYIDEGKAHFSLGLGCTGGQHRSVCIAEALGNTLVESGWQTSIRHRELDRQ